MPRPDVPPTGLEKHRAATAIARGAALQQAGRLSEAEAIYRGVLREEPRHAPALTLLGLIHLQRGEPAQALRRFDASLEVEPRQVPALVNRGKALAALDRHAEAVASYDKAITLKPDAAQAYYHRGNAHAGRRRYPEALADFDRVLALKPEHALAHNDRGNVLQALGRLDDALLSFDKAIALKPGLASAYFNRGNLLEKLKRYDDAIANYEMAIARDPAFAAAHNNLGNALRQRGRYEDALGHYDTVITLRGDHPQAYNNRGSVLHELGRLDEALASFEKAIALKPDYVRALYNRGNLLAAWDRHDEALASFDKAVALAPDHLQAWNNRGLLLQALGRRKEALESFERAIAIAPDDPAGHWNKSLLLLLMGDFDQGWRLHEWRRRNERLSRPLLDFTEPLWLGQESLAGKTILLHAEQGFGDTIQFCRYAEAVAARGATVILAVPKSLKSLMESLEGPSHVVTRSGLFLRFDYQTPLLSLPLAFRTGLDSIPARVPYLSAGSGSIAYWGEALGERRRPRVGLAWSGRPSHRNDRERSIALAELLPLLGCDVDLIGLQKEVRPDDEAALANGARLRNLGPSLADFADTAALIANLDLVISVDTAVAHLAGALGKPVWILLPFAPDWRWLLAREDSPWYPTARLFRQASIGDWPGVVARVVDALDGFAGARCDTDNGVRPA